MKTLIKVVFSVVFDVVRCAIFTVPIISNP